MVILHTKLGAIQGNEKEGCYEFLGVRYATAARFEYAKLVEPWEGTYDATHFGDACPQKRQFYPHYENKARKFYWKEFRENDTYTYSEDCLNLNIWAPEQGEKHPVIVFIHGGGFDSCCNCESNIDGKKYAKRGVIMVAINYRVGVFGYFTNKENAERNGSDGNFGLDDQMKAIMWVKENIADYGGDPDNITLMGQSAGAISIQYLCLNKECNGLFQRVIMMSGGGMFPKFALPRLAADTNNYWDRLIEISGCKTLDEFKALDHKSLFDAWEQLKGERKDNTYNTMPVIDGRMLVKPVDELIKEPLNVDYMIGYTNNDMYAYLMMKIGIKFAKDNKAYTYFFDIDAPGDKNKAFHSCDLRYAFGTLDRSWRPYAERDYEVSEIMIDYFSNYAKSGDPNGKNLPIWEINKKKSLGFADEIKMVKPPKLRLIYNTVYGLKIR